jgi:beta-glucosidase-like glycosyl hydrolase/CubicO group peptidase (beta-lactamase class C family)
MKHLGTSFIFTLLFILSFSEAKAQHTDDKCRIWVDSLMNELSTEDKIAQLISIRTYSNKEEGFYKEIDKIVKRHKIGGLCFFQGGPARQAELTNRWQELSDVPMLIALDAEWGLGMRLDSTISYPRQMTLGAIQNDSLIYYMGCAIAEQLSLVGTQINFAPVADINSNPMNPVINTRSFGENRENVARKSIMYMHGLQNNNIIATAKHFPGHGDTDSDSHYTLPLINHNKQRMDSLELYPFKAMIDAGLGGIMTAHLYIPLYEQRDNRASTLSHNIVSGLLSDSLGFEGLKVTDALDMSGVTKYFKPGETELEAYKAGNDILLLALDVPKAIRKIKHFVKESDEEMAELDRRCRKVLTAKYKAGLANYQPVNPKEVTDGVNDPKYQPLRRALYQASVTILKDRDSLLPLLPWKTGKTAYIHIGNKNHEHINSFISRYIPVDTYSIPLDFNLRQWGDLKEKLCGYQTIITTIHTSDKSMKNGYGISPELKALLSDLDRSHDLIVSYIGNPYGLSYFEILSGDALVLSYEDNFTANDMLIQSLFGAFKVNGVLPVSINDTLKEGFGIIREATNTLRYGCLEDAGTYQHVLAPIDSIINHAIANKGMPGCQLFVAKDGNVIINKNYGYHTYENKKAVGEDDIYDVASITKVAATTLTMMKLYEEGIIDIDHRLSRYLPDLLHSNKKDIIIREMMAHQSALQAWIPYYKNTVDEEGNPLPEYYAETPDAAHTIYINDKMFLRNDYPLVIYDTIRTSELRETTEYKYSDLGFILLHRTIEQLTNQPLERYVEENFYRPLGLQHIGYNPLLWYDKEAIVPTEEEPYFRKGLIHGTVHDPAAAMLGGVSGHAGVFSNAHDLGVILQCLIQEGNYAGIQVLDSAVIREFTKCQFPLNENRRGVGFDKPLLDFYEDGPVCKGASPSSFGHSGFTGTYFWGDPEKKLVYVFLSNRVYPEASNNLILKENVRTNIHQILYDSLY